MSRRCRWLTLLFVAGALFYRRPEALLQPQFWQEDGGIFFQQNYELGARAIVLPYAGYLNLLPRLVAALGGWFPLVAQPAIYAWGAFAVALAVAARLVGGRILLPHAPLLAAALALVPHRGAIFLMLTNVQWLLAVALFSLVFTCDPKTWREAAGDVILLLVAGLTGPFIVLATPPLLLRALWLRPSRFGRGLAAGAIALSLVQWYFVRTTMPPAPAVRVDVMAGIAALGQNTIADLFLGPQIARFIPAPAGFALLTAANLLPLALVWKRGPELRWAVAVCLAFGSAMVAAALFNHLADPHEVTVLGGSERYYYLPRLMVVWSLIFCLWHPISGKDSSSRVALGLLILALFSSATYYQRRTVIDYDWAEQSKKLALAADPVVLITHPGSEMRVHPKGHTATTGGSVGSYSDLFGMPPRSVSAETPPERFTVGATTLLRVGPAGEMRFAVPARATSVQGRFAARPAETLAQPVSENLAGVEFRLEYLPADRALPSMILFNRVLRPLASGADRTVQPFRVTLPPDASGEIVLRTFSIPGTAGNVEKMDAGWTGVRFY